MHRHHKNVTQAGKPLAEANYAMIMVHGRGAAPVNILEVANLLPVDDFALLAPAAAANTWYPYSFMAPTVDNEPGLSTGLGVIKQIVDEAVEAGIPTENIYLLGFSQGACLSAEFLARNAKRYGGAFLYSGGLIGPKIDRSPYQGDFQGTPILLGCSDIDAHVPLHRVQDSTQVLRDMGAEVDERIYPNAPHTIFKDEIEATIEVLNQNKIQSF